MMPNDLYNILPLSVGGTWPMNMMGCHSSVFVTLYGKRDFAEVKSQIDLMRDIIWVGPDHKSPLNLGLEVRVGRSPRLQAWEVFEALFLAWKWRGLLPSRGSLPNVHRRQYYGTGFWEKKRLLSLTPLARRQEARLKSCSSIQGLWWDFKGFQHQIFLDKGPFTSIFRSLSCPHPLFSWQSLGEAVTGSQVLLVRGIHKCCL